MAPETWLALFGGMTLMLLLALRDCNPPNE